MHLLSVLAVVGSLLAGSPAAPDHDLVAAVGVLHSWDARRAAAWAADDPVALRRLYVARSGAGAADVRLLRRYAGRGLVVRRIVTQVLVLQVLHLDHDRARLRVVDRVAGGLVVDVAGDGRPGTAERPLGTTLPTLRVVELRRVDGAWRVVSVRRPAPRPARP